MASCWSAGSAYQIPGPRIALENWTNSPWMACACWATARALLGIAAWSLSSGGLGGTPRVGIDHSSSGLLCGRFGIAHRRNRGLYVARRRFLPAVDDGALPGQLPGREPVLGTLEPQQRAHLPLAGRRGVGYGRTQFAGHVGRADDLVDVVALAQAGPALAEVSVEVG